MAKRLVKPPPPDRGEQPPPAAGWAKRIEHALAGVVLWVFDLLFESISSVLAHGAKSWMEDMEVDLIELTKPVVNDILGNPDVPDSIKTLLAKALGGEHQAGAAILGGVATSVGTGAAGAFLAPVFRMINYGIDRVIHTARVDPAVAFAMIRRVPETREKVEGDMKDLGWTDVRLKGWEMLTEPVIPESGLLVLWFRYPDRRGGIEAELKARGWTPARIENLREANIPRPGVQEEILFAVRDIYDAGAVSRFGLDAEFPAAFGEFAEKLGIPPEDQRRYWAAHWTLPGAQLGYLMKHRLRPGRADVEFTEADLNQLLKALDFSPFWRDKLAAISEAIFTRVDVRRMYGAGVIDRDEVYASYKDLGYADWRAEALTEFAIQDAGGAGKDITRAAIQEGYERALLDRAAAIEELLIIGYDDYEAEFWIAMSDWEIAKKEGDEIVKVVEKLYVSGEMGLSQAYTELANAQVPPARQERLISMWDIKKKAKVKLTSKSELDEWYKADLIDVGELTESLRKLGWDQRRTELFILRLDQELAILASKEAERAQVEQERIAKAEKSTAYQKDKADLDLQIALVNLEIADLKVAINQSEDSELIEQYKTTIIEDRAFIAAVRVAKADLRVDLTEFE